MPVPGLSALRLRPRTARPGPLAQAAAAYRRAPLPETLTGLVLLVALIAAAAHSLGGSPAKAAAYGAAAVLLLHIGLRRPAVIITCALLGGFAAMSPLVGMFYMAASGNADYGIVMTLWVAAALISVLAHRTSVGRAPVTVAVALVALSLLGPCLTFLLPGLGLLPGYGAAAVVLAVRAGRVRVPRRRTKTIPNEANIETSAILADLGDDSAVLRDVLPVRSADRIGHLVLSPSGISAVTSVALSGVVREHGTRGLELDGEPFARLLTPVLASAQNASAALGTGPDDVVPVLVVHGAHLPSPRTVVALVDSNGRPAGQVRVVAPAALLAEVAGDDEVVPAETLTVLIKRARRMTRRKAGHGTDQQVPAEQHTVTVLDEAGLPKQFTEPGDPQPLFRSTSVDSTVLVGQQVALLTDQGTFAGVRVCSAPQADQDATIMVQVCAESEWGAAKSERRDPEGFPYPLASVTAS